MTDEFPKRDLNTPILLTDLKEGELEAILAKYSKNLRPCGDCTLCCKVMAVPEIAKPWDKWCQHCDPKKGCNIYPTRPLECKSFYCMWALGIIPESLKPNKVHVVMSTTLEGKHLVVHHDPDYPEAHNVPRMREFYRSAIKQGFKVICRKGTDYYEFDHVKDLWYQLIQKEEEHGFIKVFKRM